MSRTSDLRGFKNLGGLHLSLQGSRIRRDFFPFLIRLQIQTIKGQDRDDRIFFLFLSDFLVLLIRFYNFPYNKNYMKKTKQRNRGTGYFGSAWGAQTFFLFIILCIVIVVSTGMGYISISSGDVLKIITAKLTGKHAFLSGMDELFPVVVMDVRLPRILTAAIVGGGLALSGCVFQGILLNPWLILTLSGFQPGPHSEPQLRF